MAVADLYVTKGASQDPVGVGQPLTYTITVGNLGPDAANSVGLTDSIPVGVCISDITVSQGSYCYENGVITWTAGVLDPFQVETMEVTVIPQSAGTISNTALVYHVPYDDDNDPETPPVQDEDPNLDNNRADLEVTVNPSADLAIIKTSCPTDTVVGSPVEYLITVFNNGPSAATGVTVTDTLPSGVTVGDILPSQGSCDLIGNTVSCDIGSLELNQIATISITITPNTEGPIQNTANVAIGEEETDPNPENNESSVTTNVGPSADISVTKVASSSEVILGQPLTYTITVTNNGPSEATNVIVVDSLPTNVDSGDIGKITPGSYVYDPIANTIAFDPINLANGASAIMTIEITPPEEGMICNSATATAYTDLAPPVVEEDPNPCNNTASVCSFVTLTGGTDISVTKTHSPEPAGICSPVLYTITVTNNGPLSATGIVLVDNLPPSLDVISINSTQGRCCICGDTDCERNSCCNHKDKHKADCSGNHHPKKPQGCRPIPCNKPNSCQQDHCHENCIEYGYHPDYCPGGCGTDSFCDDNCHGVTEIICQLGALPAHQSAIVKILARPNMLGTINNTAIVTVNERDTNPLNNEFTDTLTVITVSEQIDNLINRVNEMIASGDIAPQYGQILIDILNAAKISECSVNSHEAECDIRNFINKVKMYIEKGIINEELGCELVRTAVLILEALKCKHTCCKAACSKTC